MNTNMIRESNQKRLAFNSDVCSQRNILNHMRLQEIKNDMVFSEKTGNHAVFLRFNDYQGYTNKARQLCCRSERSCYWCGREQSRSRSRIRELWRIDLLRSIDRGGFFHWGNMVASCRECFLLRYGQEDRSDQEWYDFAEAHLPNPNRERTERYVGSLRSHRDWVDYEKRLRREAQSKPKYHNRNIRKRITAEDVQRMRSLEIPDKRRAKELKTKNKEALRRELKNRGENYCVWCRRDLKDTKISLDHLIPTSHGGSHWINNVVASCGDCNNHRMSMDAKTFLEYAINPDIDLISARLEKLETDPRSLQSFWKRNQRFYEGLYDRTVDTRYALDIMPLPKTTLVR